MARRKKAVIAPPEKARKRRKPAAKVEKVMEAEAPVAVCDTVFVIAKEYALTGTLKGLLAPGDRVSAEDLRDGQEGFHRWLKAGVIVARK
jgi:hypothetical protein